jgi:hypothetical protein
MCGVLVSICELRAGLIGRLISGGAGAISTRPPRAISPFHRPDLKRGPRGGERRLRFFFLKNRTFQNQNSQTMFSFLKLAKIAK